MPRINLRSSFFQSSRLTTLWQKIAQLTTDETNQIITLFNSIDFLADRKKEKNKFSKELAEKISAFSPQETGPIFEHICDVLDDLGKTEFNEDDIEDSAPIEDFSEKDKEAIFSLFREIHKGTNYYSWTKVRSYAHSGPEVLLTTDWAVDIRGVFKTHYRYVDENITDYKPEIENTIPVVILDFVGRSPFEKHTFQVDEEGLDKLINNLMAAQKQLLEIKKAWEGKNEQRK